MENLARTLTPTLTPGGAFCVAVIGGGYAGMAAAVELADAGVTVTVFEAAPVLGGRARRVLHRGTVLDNGLHIGIGAYRSLLDLGARVRGDASAGPGTPGATGWIRRPLDWRILGGSIRGDIHLRAPRWPAPLHLAAALAGARGLSIGARWDALRLIAGLRRNDWRVDPALTVGDWLAVRRQCASIVDALWGPLCVAALNTPLHTASAQVFAHVLRDSLGADRGASDLLLPATDLTELFPAPAALHVEARGGTILCGQRVERIERLEPGLDEGRHGHQQAQQHERQHERQHGVQHRHRPGYRVILRGDPAPTGDIRFDALVLATAPRALADLVADWPALQSVHRQVIRYTHEPITSIYLQYPETIALAGPMLGLAAAAGDPGQWVFDRGQLTGQRGLLGVVISASAAQRATEAAILAEAVHQQLARLVPGLPRPAWSKVITEKLATFTCTPGLDRPGTTTEAPGVFLAGDHVASDYPATLEGAVRSGQLAARAAVAYRHRRACPP